ncbi:MAG: Hsp20 family protein [Kiloniellales bacterium]
MTRLSLFSSPFLLGFEPFEKAVDRISKAAADGYPPYNVEQRGEGRFRISVAVAGFAMEELNVQMEGNQLIIRGKQGDHEERVYLHRGIAARQFQRSFVLAEGIEVTSASLDSGLLHVDLERPRIEPEVRSIAIKAD